MIHLKTVRKDIEQHLKVYSIEELIIDCRRILKDLKKYPIDNKNQIVYYTKFWNLLSEY